MTRVLLDQPGATPASGAPRLSAPTARSVCIAAVTLGVVADSLFRDGVGGVALGLWILLLALNLTSLVWRDGRSLPREAAAWLAAAVLFGFGLAWRNSETLGTLDIFAALGCLGMAVIRLRDRRAALFAARFRYTLLAAARTLRDTAAGLIPIAFRELWLPGDGERLSGQSKPFVRAALLSAAMLIVFGSLLRGADPIFASLIALPSVDLGELIQHAFLIALFSSLAAGWIRSSLLPTPEHRGAATPFGFSLGMLDVTTTLGTLNALFAVFLLAQLGWFFGGEEFLRQRTGLTAAAYARQGFFQMVWVVALVVPLLVVTRGALRPGRELARRHTLLALPAIGLLAAMILSAVFRMKMYVHYYGLTTDRLYPLVFMGWLSLVLAWLGVTVLRDRGRPFAAGSIVSGLFTLLAMNIADPDAIVARVNIERASRIAPAAKPALDVAYLATLGGAAVPLATRAVLSGPVGSEGSALRKADDAQRCSAATSLLRRFGPSRRHGPPTDVTAAWRFWNVDDTAALRVVRQNHRALLGVAHATCSRGAASSS